MTEEERAAILDTLAAVAGGVSKHHAVSAFVRSGSITQ